jgi:hypothetical protein
MPVAGYPNEAFFSSTSGIRAAQDRAHWPGRRGTRRGQLRDVVRVPVRLRGSVRYRRPVPISTELRSAQLDDARDRRLHVDAAMHGRAARQCRAALLRALER